MITLGTTTNTLILVQIGSVGLLLNRVKYNAIVTF